MASILCRKGERFPSTHTHTSVAEVRVCHSNYRTQGVDPSTPRPPAPQPMGGAWGKVNNLRNAVGQYLAPKPSGKKQGWFAIFVPSEDGGSVVKFYRVSQLFGGRVYVDVQASDTYYPVKTPASLELVLSRIVAAPEKAAMRYASELGRCYRCGRTLTDETSRSIGMGPECRSKL